MQQQFLKKFFPSHRTNSFKRQITIFTQKPGETFYQYWDRYRDLLNTCPHHCFETWRLVSHFYEGLTPKDRQMVELKCNETFEDKDLIYISFIFILLNFKRLHPLLVLYLQITKIQICNIYHST
jgi:hypothetical protein